MKKIILLLIAILSVLFVGCNNENVEPEKQHWNVTFEIDGGKIISGESEQVVLDKTKISVSDFPIVKKDGYELIGWFYDNSLIENEIIISKDMKIFAMWEKVNVQEKYKINYFLNGGTFVNVPKDEYIDGETIYLDEPILEGKIFIGWYLSSDFSGEAITKIGPNKIGDVTLYAKYGNPTIEYNLNGGYFLEEAKYEYTIGSVYYLLEPERDEYLFGGWYLTSDFSGKMIDKIDATFNSNVILYAKWEDLYERKTITYELKGGKIFGDYPTTYPEGKGCELPTPVRDGYDFLGWLDTGLNRTIFEISSRAFGNKTLVALWEKIYVYSNIKYELDGGTLPHDAPTVYPEGKGAFLVPATKLGYFFRGYFYNSDFSGKEVTWVDSSKKGEIMVYAKWEKAKLENAKISFYGDSITTFAGYIPEGYASYYPYSVTKVTEVSDTWWYQTVEGTGAKLVANNSCGATAVIGGDKAGIDKNRMKLLASDELGVPDIVVILLGINDVVNKRSTSLFKTNYQKMLSDLKEMYPQTIFFLCTLPYETYTGSNSPGLREAFSEIITEIGNSNGCPIIDFEKVFTSADAVKLLGDTIHPSKDGMEVMSKEAIKTIKEYFNKDEIYNIYYNLDCGGWDKTIPITSYSKLTNSLHLETPTKNDYIFLGWYDENGNLVTKIDVNSRKDYYLTARWKKIISDGTECEVTIIDITGEERKQSVPYGGYLDNLENTYDKHLKYVWLVDTELFDPNMPITSDLTIKETWLSVYEIISQVFNKNIFDDLTIGSEYSTSGGKTKVLWKSSDKNTINTDSGRVNPGREDIDVYISASFVQASFSTNYTFKVRVKSIDFKSLDGKKPVIAYLYSNTKNLLINELTKNTIDIANYGFARASSNGTVVIGELTNMDDVLVLRKYGIRVLLCIGGYSTAAKGFSDTASTKELREKFAKSIVDAIEKYHFDGVDIDWEYPGFNTGRETSEDKVNYTLLMREIYRQVKEANSDYIVSAAIPGGIYGYNRYELSNVNSCLDYVNLMTYDLQSDGKVTHHTALYSGSYTPSGSVKQSVDTFLNLGVSKEKLIVGIAFYGRVFTLSGKVDNPLGSTLVTSGGKNITFTNIYNDYLIKTYTQNANVIRGFDDVSKAPYIYDTINNIVITYDDSDSIAYKCKYVIDNDLGGVMFWDYGEDSTFMLLNSIYRSMK